MKYYKVTKDNEKHYDMQYKTGLNVDVVPFFPGGTCMPGGMYYAREDILAFIDYGIWIREVTIPEDAQVHEESMGGGPRKWKADKIILGERRKINAEVFKELIDEGADIHAGNDVAIRHVTRWGCIEATKILIEAGADIEAMAGLPLQGACSYGNIDLVKLIIKSGVNVRTNFHALDLAVLGGHIKIVKLLIKHGAEAKIFLW